MKESGPLMGRTPGAPLLNPPMHMHMYATVYAHKIFSQYDVYLMVAIFLFSYT